MPGFDPSAPPGDPAMGSLTGVGVAGASLPPAPVYAGPRYPSNYFDKPNNVGGAIVVDNIGARRELKHTTIATPGQLGLYPTDQGMGRQSNTNPTDLLNDLQLSLKTLELTLRTDDWSKISGAVAAYPSPTTSVFGSNVVGVVNDPTIVGQYLVFTSGALAGQAKKITAYAVTNGVITVAAAFTAAPTAADAFQIVSRPASAGWDVASAGLSTTEAAYAANLLSLKIHHVIAAAENLTYAVKDLSADFVQINSSGSLGTSRYPSGQNRGY